MDDLNELYYFLKSDRWISLIKHAFFSNELLELPETIVVDLVTEVDFINCVVQVVGVGHTISEQLLHFWDPLVDIVTKFGSTFTTLLLALPNLPVISGIRDAVVLAFVDFEVELHIEVLQKKVELLDLSFVVFS